MLAHKNITKIVSFIMVIAVILCLTIVVFSDSLIDSSASTGISVDYESKLFDTSEIISINIIMDESEWDEMLQNATSETYYQCDVEVNGTMFYQVGIRPKGNTSLTSIASDQTTERYSLKLEFDHYVDGQTCFGLDKLILNNNYADATNMKEALIYDMFQYLGADASLYNYAKISLNGDYWGVYLALESVEDSFLLRNYGVSSGQLYKPDSMNIGGMGDNFDTDNIDFNQEFTPDSENNGQFSGNFDLSQFQGEEMSEDFSMSESYEDLPDMNNFDFSDISGMFDSVTGGGANLNYIDDDLSSYSTIWDNEVTSTSTSDHERVVEALKNISEGNDLEEYMDVDNLLKYMAVHVFSVNSDSLSGMMAHNYYLYEDDGQLNLIPWDYNLSLGGMESDSDATSIVNDAIDDAFSGTEFFDTLMENEEYHAQYYAYLQQLVDEYILGDGFESFYQRTRSQIDELVETDPTAFYTYDEYLTAVDTLYQVVKLRGESIDGQLNGSIPSTDSEQRESDALIDASGIDISVMGSMDMGGGGENGFSFTSTSSENDNSSMSIPDDFDPSQSADTSFDFSDMPDNFDDFTDDTSSAAASSSTNNNLLAYGIYFLILIAALLFAKLYHRRARKR